MPIKSSDSWGPFDPAISACERIARLRALRAIVRLIAGPRGDAVTRALRCAEEDPRFLERAMKALEGLAALDKRRIWSGYLAMIEPPQPCTA